MSLLLGAARRDITPKKPLFLWGYPYVPRTSTGVHDPLWASAMAIRNGDRSVILIAADALFICPDGTHKCREAIRAKTGVPPECVLISTTHGHSAPVVVDYIASRADPTIPPPDPEYIAQYHQAVSDAAIEAFAKAEPAELAATSAQVSGVGTNRLSPDAPRDPEVGLLYARRLKDSSPLALAMVYAMHPTVLHEDSKLVSADFPGYARDEIGAAFPGLTVLYHNGAAGNQSPRYSVKGQTFAEAERLGRILGRSVTVALAGLKAKDFSHDPVLAGRIAKVNPIPRKMPSVADAEAANRAALENFERLKREGAPHGPVRTAECTTFGTMEALLYAKLAASGELQARLRRYLPSEAQVLRIGDQAIVGLPGEFFVEYALEIKKRAPMKTSVVCYANGELQGYIVTPEAAAAGGYEAQNSVFDCRTGTLFVDAALALLRDLA
ncbi:MAG: neutral/alkaline non-lysosomal ceramidase N-terminal domain-containing protein [Verrucomicrobiae bacterium]|nr:neutral/alkaline non-lysosomal ceramidase N-terminal domain-containing protein [Verrucomicrobiae bacterium]